MTSPENRSAAMAEAFVRLIDTLGPDYDLSDAADHLTTACAELLPADASAVLLADTSGVLRVAAHRPTTPQAAELFDVDRLAGPGQESFTTGDQVVLPALDDTGSYRRFASAARSEGYRTAQAFPMQRRADRVGALTLLQRAPGPLERADTDLAQALATVATLGIVHQRAYRASRRLTEQLQGALSSRVAIEQAKGFVAAHNSGNLDAAFEVIRSTARTKGIRIHDVALAIIDGRISAKDMARQDDQNQ